MFYLKDPASMTNNFCLVPIDVQLCDRHNRIGLLYLPIPRNHFFAHDFLVPVCGILLPPIVRRDKEVGLPHAIHFVWVILWYELTPCITMACTEYLFRDLNRSCNYSSIPESGAKPPSNS